MTVLAAVYLEPGGIISWVFVGLIAGFLAGKVMKGSGYGVIGDIVVGLTGAFLGGILFGSLVDAQYAFFGSIAVAFIGACVLIAIVRLISGVGSRL